jgi:hypothetical protein
LILCAALTYALYLFDHRYVPFSVWQKPSSSFPRRVDGSFFIGFSFLAIVTGYLSAKPQWGRWLFRSFAICLAFFVIMKTLALSGIDIFWKKHFDMWGPYAAIGLVGVLIGLGAWFLPLLESRGAHSRPPR